MGGGPAEGDEDGRAEVVVPAARFEAGQLAQVGGQRAPAGGQRGGLEHREAAGAGQPGVPGPSSATGGSVVTRQKGSPAAI